MYFYFIIIESVRRNVVGNKISYRDRACARTHRRACGVLHDCFTQYCRHADLWAVKQLIRAQNRRTRFSFPNYRNFVMRVCKRRTNSILLNTPRAVIAAHLIWPRRIFSPVKISDENVGCHTGKTPIWTHGVQSSEPAGRAKRRKYTRFDIKK